MKYDHRRIEQKWQKYWEVQKTFKAEIDHSKPKYYILDMFPYPSGSGLHVGHVTGYTATDILSRYKRQKGFNVLHPMGWDSFGLPAEQYAIRTGTHPYETTKKNITTYRKQLKSLGFSYDWDREISTSDPDYYKWTQWIFTKLYEKGLAYEAKMLVNYCPTLGTVLANEEVEDGVSKEGGYPVERRPLRQWILKITAYAQKLLDDLEFLDWPDSLKKLQRNWIGRSEGAKIHFKILGINQTISVFTTRHETLFGVTFLAISPEHPLVKSLTTDTQKIEVNNYLKKAATKSDLQRTDLAKVKTGVFSGMMAINPATKKEIPIWIADYVLMGYGTGAVMGVPGNDERDFEFAQIYDLPINPVVDPDFDLKSEPFSDSQTAKLERETILRGEKPWIGLGVICNSKNDQLDLDGCKFNQAKEKISQWLETSGVGERTISYRLRDWLFSRQRYWGEPFPILHFEDGTKRLLDISELPLSPPELIDFKPTESGESPLARVPDWVYITDSKTGKKAKREINTMPQWAGSCWYYLRFCDPQNNKEAWNSDKEKYWLPVDMYVGGVEHAVLHLLYARFWHKVLYDINLVSTKEPFQTLRNQGLVTAKSYKLSNGGYVNEKEVFRKNGEYFQLGTEAPIVTQIEKMSKSKLNGVTPDEMIEEYGADSLRLYEMFMAPFDKEKLWNSDAVNGCSRFLNRVYDVVFSDKVTDQDNDEALRLGYKLVEGVEKDIDNLQFNTAIAKMMEFMNAFALMNNYPKKVVKMLVQVLYPFAPHISEEAWEHLGSSESLTYVAFPEIDSTYLVEDTITYVIQVNGKLRGSYELPNDQTQEKLLSLAKKEPKIAKYLEGEIKKVIFVPNKLLNIVVKK